MTCRYFAVILAGNFLPVSTKLLQKKSYGCLLLFHYYLSEVLSCVLCCVLLENVREIQPNHFLHLFVTSKQYSLYMIFLKMFQEKTL